MHVPIRIWVCAVLLLSSTGVAATQSGKKEEPSPQAQEQYNQGKIYFAAGKYKEAMDAFTESYNLSGNPNLLFNLAVCAEKLGDLERAKAYYEVYLEEKPDAPDVDQVKAHLEKLKQGAQPQGDEAREQTDQPEPADTSEQAASQPQEPGRQGLQVSDEERIGAEKKVAEYFEGEQDETEVFWPGVTIGLGGLVIASGTVTAILAYKKHSDLEKSCSPNCTDDDISSAKALALASDIQFAVGAAAVVTGVFLWVFNREEAVEAPVAWRTGPAVLADGAQIVVEGRF